jgi:hypothetical protein
MFFYKYAAPMALPIPSPRLCVSALKSFPPSQVREKFQRVKPLKDISN